MWQNPSGFVHRLAAGCRAAGGARPVDSRAERPLPSGPCCTRSPPCWPTSRLGPGGGAAPWASPAASARHRDRQEEPPTKPGLVGFLLRQAGTTMIEELLEKVARREDLD